MSNRGYTPEMTGEERLALRRLVTKEIPPGLLAELYLTWRERAENAEARILELEKFLSEALSAGGIV